MVLRDYPGRQQPFAGRTAGQVYHGVAYSRATPKGGLDFGRLDPGAAQGKLSVQPTQSLHGAVRKIPPAISGAEPALPVPGRVRFFPESCRGLGIRVQVAACQVRSADPDLTCFV